MANTFENRLTGGHPNSLGNTIEIVEEVLLSPEKFEELFQCYFSNNEVVRLRVSNSMKRIAKSDRTLIIPYVDRLLDEISKIDQASTQWTLASLFLLLQNELSKGQKEKAVVLLKNNLETHSDWIVLNTTMETLYEWSKKDESIKSWLLVELNRLQQDTRKSVAKRASKYLKALTDKK